MITTLAILAVAFVAIVFLGFILTILGLSFRGGQKIRNIIFKK